MVAPELPGRGNMASRRPLCYVRHEVVPPSTLPEEVKLLSGSRNETGASHTTARASHLLVASEGRSISARENPARDMDQGEANDEQVS